MYIHLTGHSVFFLQEGPLSPTNLVKAVKSNGMLALGLTDHNYSTGVIEFAKACQEVEIQPIIALEIGLIDGRIGLLATSVEGWSNLCRLSSKVALGGNPEEFLC